MMRILIADDHAIVRKGLKQILDEEPGMAIVGEAQNAQEVLDMVRRQKWDMVILDISMPGRSGLDVLSELRQNSPHLPVLILSMHPEDQFALRVLKAGAAGYMNKQSAPEELVEAIHKIHRGGRYISQSLAEKMAMGLNRNDDRPVHELLSDREYQVMQLIASGKTISEIAEILSLSVKTVSTYRARILSKMNMKNNAELTYYAVSNKLVGAQL
ncbi:MAG: response regulator transcription factor [Chloroflexi bacterium]|jgi:two-component system invasion response regulator UvrY|nr:response regulator transcription factor [Anaerolineaceae bacterium]NMB87584.1 response regulator transcription factor [Chloroflexota bacterium]